MDNKQTAVQKLINDLANSGLLVTRDFENLVAYRKALAMEREQHKETWLDSTAQFSNDAVMDNQIDFEIYYTQAFKQ